MDFTTKEIAHKIAAAACDKKAKDILLLNMENISPVTDYFIIASAGNNILVKAIADNIEDKLAEAGILLLTKKAMLKVVGFCWIMVIVLRISLLKKNASSIIWNNCGLMLRRKNLWRAKMTDEKTWQSSLNIVRVTLLL